MDPSLQFRLAAFGDNGAPAASGSVCSTFDAYASTLHIPCVDLAGTHYWVDLGIDTWTPLLLGLRNFGMTDRGSVEGEVCGNGATFVALLVDPALAGSIRNGLSRFETDLCNDGYTVIERVSAFSTPSDVRAYLASLYSTTGGKLEGAILIGNLPHAYQWVILASANPSIPSLKEEVISFQYYADLNGSFGASPGYVSPGGHSFSYDIHSGDVNWEIWVGVMPLYKGDYLKSIEAINRYFNKNHAYRTGAYTIPRAFLDIFEFSSAATLQEQNTIMSQLTTGTYAWTPFSNASNAHIYFNSPPGNLSVAQGYAQLSAGAADFTVIDAHGSWLGTGQINIPWVESHPVNTVFFWSNGCAVGDLDHADNFLTSALYSPTSSAVVAKGTTNNSGGMGSNANGFFGHNIATAMSQGKSIGQAILSHVNVPLIYPWSDSREFHTGTTIILGDPTLKLRTH